ncbi:alpha/beta hydrolase [Candidatus Uabimicrobium sp. HlEnr_7]|uniref:alpha/beta hydrolase n=1 Tax=Candidatus Uabimicrobium helgolandensis TaxID=3095367 RepID=UPI003556F0AE
MKQRIFSMCIVCSFLFFACKNSSTALVASNGKEYVFGAQQDFDSFMHNNIKSKKKLLLYVNGKGPEPLRSQISVIPYIEKHYDVEVCMFRWPSFGWIVGYPIKNAKNSSDELQLCLQKMKGYLAQNKKSCSLFVHSMGNIVLQNFLKNYENTLPDVLFDNVILNAADIHFENHEQLLKKINFAQRIYIPYSRCDRVLRLSQIFKNKGRLRLGQAGYTDNSPAIYVDFSEVTGIYHEYFRGPSPYKKLAIRHFFYEVFHGEEAATHHFKVLAENHYRLF